MTAPDRCLGQVAYEAYCEATSWVSMISGATLPPWAHQGQGVQDAWDSAAHAVVREIQEAP